MKTFKEYFNQNINLTFVMDKQSKISGYNLVNIDVKKFDNLWKQDKDFYIGPNGTGAAITKPINRYERFKTFLKDGEPIEAPVAAINLYGVGFVNGRHRFAVLRDMGVKTIPLTLNDKSIKNAREMGLLE